jgi:hypothetical protein
MACPNPSCDGGEAQVARSITMRPFVPSYAPGCELHSTMWGGGPRIGSLIDSAAFSASLD